MNSCSIPACPPQPYDERIVASILGAIPDLLAIYRYGSAGSPHERTDSDLDLAVLGARSIDPEILLELPARLAGLVGRDVDLHDMRRLPVSLRVQIVTQGRRLFAAQPARADDYDSRALSDYAHLNEARRFILEDIRARGSIYG